MLKVIYEKKFKKDIARCERRSKDLLKLRKLITFLVKKHPLALTYKDHPLSGNYKGFRECHIEPDWLLIYSITPTHLNLVRTGTHSDLF